MDPSYRQVLYISAFLAFAFALGVPVLGWVSPTGRFVEYMTLLGLALIAFGLYLGSTDKHE
jgi:hypothetical protein